MRKEQHGAQEAECLTAWYLEDRGGGGGGGGGGDAFLVEMQLSSKSVGYYMYIKMLK